MSTCFLFSGQGSQYPQMGQELLKLNPEFSYIMSTASDILGYDLKELIMTADEHTLALTQNSQPAIMAMSLLSFYSVKKLGVLPDMAAGHSLGEYAAMVACGILSLEDGFKVIKARAKAMGDCAAKQKGAMCAVMNTSAEEIEKVCSEIDGYIAPVNYNSPVQTVIAGEVSAVNTAMKIFSENGIRCVKLAVNAAFHSKLMQPAADEFKKAISGIKFNSPSVPFYSNITGLKMTDFSDMPSYLSAHLVSPVMFVKELNSIKNDGADVFIECGPNKVLTGLVRKTLSDVKYFNVENEKTLTKLSESL